MEKIYFEKELNASQYKAVTHDYSPSVVIAGAGSGKTRVITYRIAYLLSQGVEIRNILGLTFTNKAANEMKERIAKLLGSNSNAQYLMLGTFHSIFNRILRKEADVIGYKADYSIYTPEDAYILIKEIVNEKKLDTKKYDYRNLYKKISYLKNYIVTPDRYESNQDLINLDKINKVEYFVDIYRTYESKKRKNNAMDFGDLLLKTYFLFRKNKRILEKYKSQFTHILIDEFQDTNIVQYEIAKMLADRDTDIMVVGDDAQSIYSFRGAVVQNINKFIEDFAAQIFFLRENYRSTQHIVLASNVLISKNSEQFKKEIVSTKGYGAKILVKEVEYDNDEANFVAKDIKRRAYSFQKQYSDFAVLYRINSQSRKIEETLMRENVPYKVYGGMSFYNRKEVKDVLAYLFFVNNSNDSVALRRIINFPKRGIGDSTVNKILTFVAENNLQLSDVLENIDMVEGLSSRAKKLVKVFYEEIKYFKQKEKDYSVVDMTKEIIKKFRIIETFKLAGEDERVQNIEELLNSMYDYVSNLQNEDAEMPDFSLRTYLETISLLTDNDEPDPEDEKVKLMTVHTAKGLEFDTVYIIGAEEELFPIRQSFDSIDKINEERRLFYVAMTRAKENLIITFANNRFKFNNLIFTEPSRFLKDLPKENCKFETIRLMKNSYDKTFESKFHNPRKFNPNISIETDNKNLKKIKNNTGTLLDSFGKIRIGSIVKHEKFGMGRVLELRKNEKDVRAVIEFETAGNKTLLLKYARLIVIN